MSSAIYSQRESGVASRDSAFAPIVGPARASLPARSLGGSLDRSPQLLGRCYGTTTRHPVPPHQRTVVDRADQTQPHCAPQCVYLRFDAGRSPSPVATKPRARSSSHRLIAFHSCSTSVLGRQTRATISSGDAPAAQSVVPRQSHRARHRFWPCKLFSLLLQTGAGSGGTRREGVCRCRPGSERPCSTRPGQFGDLLVHEVTQFRRLERSPQIIRPARRSPATRRCGRMRAARSCPAAPKAFLVHRRVEGSEAASSRQGTPAPRIGRAE